MSVAPLTLPEVENACYGLEVLNEALEPVWTEPSICADQYGDLTSAVTYIGPCDASDPNNDGTSEATVVLTIAGLYGPDRSDPDTLPDLLSDWKNPCAAPHAPGGCRLKTTCTENADTQVEFNITVMREASQGFFDIAVNFEDIFCSAKVDCAYAGPDGGPIKLVFDPATGERVQSVVFALACTDGDAGFAAAGSTHLYMDDVVLRCGATTYAVNPSAGPGNVYPGGVGAPLPLVQAMVFEGRERITNGTADADKRYWNVALGLRPSFFNPATGVAPNCVLETKATASKGPLVNGTTPTNTNYPFIRVAVPINNGSALSCTQHGLDELGAHAGVATTYTGSTLDAGGFATTAFAYVGAAVPGGIDTRPVSGSCADPAVAAGTTCDDGNRCTDDDTCQAGICVGTASPVPSDDNPCTTDTCDPVTGAPVYTIDACRSVEVVSWGSVPKNAEAATGIVALDAGDYHTVALKGDGTVVAWGYNDHGQTDVPSGLDNVVAIVAGGFHTAALKADGTVVAWGFGDYGQTTVPSGLTDVVAIVAGGFHTAALKGDGTVVAWGYDIEGQATVPSGLTNVVAIAASHNHTVALKSDGTVVAWGSNTYGQTTVPSGLNNVIAIAAGNVHTVALQADGSVVSWGSNLYGLTTVPSGLNNVVAITAGNVHTVALQGDGTVVAWGRSTEGQTTVPSGLTNVVGIAAGDSHTVALKGDGTFVAWGWNGYGQTEVPSGLNNVVALATGYKLTVALKGDGTVAAWGFNTVPGHTTVPSGLDNVVAIAAGGYHAVALKGDGTVVAWGRVLEGQTLVPSGLNDVIAIGAGSLHTVALKGDGTVVAWGHNGRGQTTIPSGLSDVVAITGGDNHTVALKGDGTVVAWGGNGYGQATVPSGLNNVVAITAGEFYTVALKGDGTVVAWGYNDYGQTTVPSGLNNVIAISARTQHTVALKGDGTVVAWGHNDFGQTTVPSGLNNVVAICAGDNHSVALQSINLGPAPTVAGLDTFSGVVGDTVTVTGTGFEQVAAVRVAGRVVRWQVDSTTQLRLTVPAQQLVGPVQVVTRSGSASSAAFAAN